MSGWLTRDDPSHRGVWPKQLVRDSRDIEARDEHGSTPLLLAAENGRTDVVRFLCKEAKADIEARYKNGNTSLHSAAAYGHIDVMRFLCRKAKKGFLCISLGSSCLGARNTLQLNR